MYCRKCGKEVNCNDGFCPNCGAKAGPSGKGLFLSADTQGNQQEIIQRLQMAPKTYYGAILCQILCVFLVGNSMFEVSYNFFISKSFEITMFENKESWKTLFILGYLAAAMAMMYPVLLNKIWKKGFFFPGIAMPAAGIIWMLTVSANAAKGAGLGKYRELADTINLSAGLTANAWMFLLVSIGGAVLTYMAMKRVANVGSDVHKIEPNQKAPAKVVGVTILPKDKVKDGRDIRLTFELADGSKMNLLEKSEYQAKLGDEGILTWNGGIVVFFEKPDT